MNIDWIKDSYLFIYKGFLYDSRLFMIFRKKTISWNKVIEIDISLVFFYVVILYYFLSYLTI